MRAKNTHPSPLMEDLGQSIASELHYALNDIRQKVVEQGWNGQVQTSEASMFYALDNEQDHKLAQVKENLQEQELAAQEQVPDEITQG